MMTGIRVFRYSRSMAIGFGSAMQGVVRAMKSSSLKSTKAVRDVTRRNSISNWLATHHCRRPYGENQTINRAKHSIGLIVLMHLPTTTLKSLGTNAGIHVNFVHGYAITASLACLNPLLPFRCTTTSRLSVCTIAWKTARGVILQTLRLLR